MSDFKREGMGRMSIWNFRRQRGFKILMPPVLGYGYFLESSNEFGHNINKVVCGSTLMNPQLL